VGIAERELDADPRRAMKLILYNISGDVPPGTPPGFVGKSKDLGLLDGMIEPESLPPWLTDADLDFYGGEFAKAGFRGGINRYRNGDRDWHELPHLADKKITQPALFVAGQRDGVIMMNPSGIETMKTLIPDLRDVVLLPGAGHWTQQERPAEVNAAMINFLKGL
jgi:pimeloyl-ACP methyl ester carboxylesterase